ncbi:MAG: InlB B-repeat-containing protein, partial [bacterium]
VTLVAAAFAVVAGLPGVTAHAKDPTVAGITEIYGYGVAVSPDGARLFVAEWEDGGIVFVDARSQQVTDRVSLQDLKPLSNMSPYSLALSPDGTRLFASIPFDGSIGVIDVAGRTVVETIRVSADPRDIAIAPNGSRLYVAHQANDAAIVSVIDTKTSQVVATIGRDILAGGGGPFGLAVAPDGRRLYVALQRSDGPGEIIVVSTATNEVVRSITPPEARDEPGGWQPRDIAFDVAGKRAFVGGVSMKHSLGVVDIGSHEFIGSRAACGTLDVVTSSPVGNVIYATPKQPGCNLFWMGTTSLKARNTLTMPGAYVRDMAVSPDGRRLYVTGSMGITVVDTGLRTVTFRANGGRGDMPAQVANLPTALEGNTFIRRGFTFTGWNTKADGSGAKYRDRAQFSFESNVVLYAQWKKTARL